ncbi:MAG TPA: glycosyltransferase family A protein [bacterium]
MTGSGVSVIMPTFNRAQFIPRAIASCLGQLEEGDELIIVDDGSTDETERVVAEFRNRCRYIKSENRGAGRARNIGLDAASGSLVGFIDSDDEWTPGKLKIQREFMRRMPEVAYCFSDFRVVEEATGREHGAGVVAWSLDRRPWEQILGAGRPVSSVMDLPRGVPDFSFHVGSMYLNELSANYINVNTLLVRRGARTRDVRFAEDTPTYEDWEYFGALSGRGAGAYLDVETACQHNHGGQRLTDAHITECARARVRIMQRVWGSDRSFLADNGRIYQKVLDEQNLLAAKGLLARGEVAAAKAHLRSMERPPVVYRLISRLPDATVRGLTRTYKCSKGWLST